MWTPTLKTIYIIVDPPQKINMSISVRFGICATIRIGQVIQCLPYAGFFVCITYFNGCSVHSV